MELIGTWEHSEDVDSFSLNVQPGFAPTLVRVAGISLSDGEVARLTIDGRSFDVNVVDPTDGREGAGAMCISTGGYAAGVQFNAEPGVLFTGGSAHVWGIPATLEEEEEGDPPTVRGSDVVAMGGATYNMALPAGSQAGDYCVLFAAHGWAVTGASASLTSVSDDPGTNWNGRIYAGTLSSTDISNGYVSLLFFANFAGAVGIVVFEGGTGGLRTFSVTRNGSGSTSRTVTTDGTPQAGDYAIYWGSARVNAATSCAEGTLLDTANGSNACGVLNGRLLCSGGADSATFTYSGSSIGDYQAVSVVKP